jgi:hypothetical protein
MQASNPMTRASSQRRIKRRTLAAGGIALAILAFGAVIYEGGPKASYAEEVAGLQAANAGPDAEESFASFSELKARIAEGWRPKHGGLTIPGDWDDIDLAVLAGLPELRSLSIRNRKIDRRLLATLPALEHIEFIGFVECSLLPGAFENAPRLPALRGLSFFRCWLTNYDIAILAETYGTTLHKLNFYGTNITDEGVSNLRTCVQLRKLDLYFTPLLSKQAVESLQPIKSLSELDVKLGDRLSGGAWKIRRAIPGIVVNEGS